MWKQGPPFTTVYYRMRQVNVGVSDSTRSKTNWCCEMSDAVLHLHTVSIHIFISCSCSALCITSVISSLSGITRGRGCARITWSGARITWRLCRDHLGTVPGSPGGCAGITWELCQDHLEAVPGSRTSLCPDLLRAVSGQLCSLYADLLYYK